MLLNVLNRFPVPALDCRAKPFVIKSPRPLPKEEFLEYMKGRSFSRPLDEGLEIRITFFSELDK